MIKERAMEKQQKNNKIEGLDSNIETSMKNFGISWKEKDNGVLFFLGVEKEEGEYKTFDFYYCDNKMNLEKVLTINPEDLSISKQKWESLTVKTKMICLYCYYGWDNAFDDLLTYELIMRLEKVL